MFFLVDKVTYCILCNIAKNWSSKSKEKIFFLQDPVEIEECVLCKHRVVHKIQRTNCDLVANNEYFKEFKKNMLQ